MAGSTTPVLPAEPAPSGRTVRCDAACLGIAWTTAADFARMASMTAWASAAVMAALGAKLVLVRPGMYPAATFPTDHHFWTFLAYCAGTGGSILIIGSAAGIAVMGLERIPFVWYLRRISFPALLGYAGGAAVYLLLTALGG